MTTRRQHRTPFTYDLAPAFDPCKSHFGGARVTVNPADSVELQSYGAHVVTIDILDPYDKRVTLHPAWDQSDTTLRHVKEFLRQQGFNAHNKGQIRRDYA